MLYQRPTLLTCGLCFVFIYLMYLCPYVGTFDLLHLVTSAIPLHPVKVLSIVCIVCMLFKHFLRRLYAVKPFKKPLWTYQHVFRHLLH